MKNKTPAPRSSAAQKTGVRKATPRKTPARKAPARQPSGGAKAASSPLRARVERVRAILDSKKGENVVVLDVSQVSGVTDYLVLCTGLNHPHLRALADEVAKQLRLEQPPLAAHRRAGSGDSEWIVLDYLDFVVHVFTPAMRSYYALEQLWKDAPVVKS